MQVSSYWRESEAVYLEMPFYPHCTFREWLYKSGKLPNPEALQLAFSQILLGIVYLHDIGLVHGRLDLDAILMGLDFDGKEQLFPIICCLAFKPAYFLFLFYDEWDHKAVLFTGGTRKTQRKSRKRQLTRRPQRMCTHSAS